MKLFLVLLILLLTTSSCMSQDVTIGRKSILDTLALKQHGVPKKYQNIVPNPSPKRPGTEYSAKFPADSGTIALRHETVALDTGGTTSKWVAPRTSAATETLMVRQDTLTKVATKWDTDTTTKISTQYQLAKTLEGYHDAAWFTAWTENALQQDYVQYDGLASALSAYHDAAWFTAWTENVLQADYVTNGSLASTLSGYHDASWFTTWQENVLAVNYLPSGALADYVTTTNLSDALSGYHDAAWFTDWQENVLAVNYVTNDALTDALSGYHTSSWFTTWQENVLAPALEGKAAAFTGASTVMEVMGGDGQSAVRLSFSNGVLVSVDAY